MELKRGHHRTPADTSSLLIVPYGIETDKIYTEEERQKSFNRTLWN